MSQQLLTQQGTAPVEQQILSYLDRLSTPNNGQLNPMFQEQTQQFENGATYRLNNGKLEKIKFEETAKIIDTSSSNSVLGIGIGAAGSGAVVGFLQGLLGGVSGNLGLSAIPPGILAIAAGWALSKWVLKGGFGNAVAKGVLVGGIAQVAAGPVEQLTAGFVGGQ